MIQVCGPLRFFSKPPQEGKIMLTLRHPHLVPIYGCGEFTRGNCSGLDLFGIACFSICVCMLVHVTLFIDKNYLQPRHQVHRDGAFGWRSPYRDQEAPLGPLAAGDVREIPEAHHVRFDAPSQQTVDTPGHQTRQHLCERQHRKDWGLRTDSGDGAEGDGVRNTFTL